MLESVTSHVILPAHERLVGAAGGLEGAAKALAASPTPETLAAAQAAWGEAGAAYAGTELFALGPLDIMVLHSQLNKPVINPTLIAEVPGERRGERRNARRARLHRQGPHRG